MKLITAFAAGLSLSTTTLAIQSAPFELVLHSDNSTLDGRTLIACHEGAAIEGLCVGPPPRAGMNISSTFQFNYTRSSPGSGILTWELTGGNFKISEGMSFFINPNTNVGVPLFLPSDTGYQYVSFDSNQYMYIPNYYNDTAKPPAPLNKPQHLENWYICLTYVGYLFETLSWVYGNGEPQNPSCQKVCVERQFAK